MGVQILVIEDNAANLELMTYLLRAFGHEALVAHDGEAGLETIRRERPDLVICDLQLPKIVGYDLAKQVKADPSLQGIPLIAVTAYAMVGDREKALAAGFDGYIPKPIAPETFVAQVEAFLCNDHLPPAKPSVVHTERIESVSQAKQPRRATILAVDNSPENLSVLRCTFDPLGYQLITVDNVAEALRLARQSPPDLILSDLHMPKQNGFDFIKAVHDDPVLSSIPFVFISSTSWHCDRMDEIGFAGAARFIQRPIEPRALIAEIEACLNCAKGQ